MLDKSKLKPGTTLFHRNLGAVIFDEHCFAMERLASDPTSIHVSHDGDMKEVSLALVQIEK